MGGRSWVRRGAGLTLALGTASAGIVLGAGTAFASDQLDIAVQENNLTLPAVVNGTAVTKDLHVAVYHDQNTQIGPATLTVDAGGLGGVADVVWPSGCTHTGLVGTCTVPVAKISGPFIWLTFGLKAAVGAADGATGTIHFKAAAPGISGAEQDETLAVGTGPDLTINQLPQLKNVKLGTTVSAPVQWSNTGNQTAATTTVLLESMPGLAFEQRFSNCQYDPTGFRAVCTINQPIAPGETLKLTAPVRVKVTSEAYYAVMAVGVEPDAPSAKSVNGYVQGTGPALTAEQVATGAPTTRPSDLNPNDNYAELDVYAVNTADFAAVGASGHAKAGQTVNFTVGMRNLGPAFIYDRSGGEGTGGVTVIIPKGTTVTKVPQGCAQAEKNGGVPIPGTYGCGIPYVEAPGDQHLYTFTLKVNQFIANDRGEVVLQDELASLTSPTTPAKYAWDKNPANNTAPIVLNSTATATPTPSASRSATASAPAAASTSASAVSLSGGLAHTGGGSDALPLALAGAGAVVVGAGAVLVTRRRKAGSHH
jgi:LPXTG-motif cell wall-anchored protein